MTESSDRKDKKEIVCPRCGEPVESKLAFSSQHCGVRAVASCKNGCKLTSSEQQKINWEASDEIFS